MRQLAGGIFVLVCLVACSSAPRAPAPITDLDTSPIKVKVKVAKGEYLVQQGDNLYRIALEHGVAYRDLALWNNLADANDIKVGQVLKVAEPDEGIKSSGEIARSAKVRTVPLTPSSDNIKEASSPQSIAVEGNKISSTQPTAPEEGGVGLNMDWPARGNLLSTFSKNGKGIDIGGKLGQPILAAADGLVVYVGGGLRGYGKMIILKHNTTYLTAYAHNNTLLVKEGDKVKKGQKIAEMGNTDTDSVKLHFEVRRFGKPVDPTKYLPS